jgi:hypothetical protein
LGLKGVGQAECAGAADGGRKLVVDHVIIDIGARGGGVKFGCNDGSARRCEDLAEKDGFELTSSFLDLLGLGQGVIVGEAFERDRAVGARGGGTEVERGNGHISA